MTSAAARYVNRHAYVKKRALLRNCLHVQTFAAERALLFTQCRLLKGKTVERR